MKKITLEKVLSAYLEKHLPGKHDQGTHAGRGGGQHISRPSVDVDPAFTGKGKAYVTNIIGQVLGTEAGSSDDSAHNWFPPKAMNTMAVKGVRVVPSSNKSQAELSTEYDAKSMIITARISPKSASLATDPYRGIDAFTTYSSQANFGNSLIRGVYHGAAITNNPANLAKVNQLHKEYQDGFNKEKKRNPLAQLLSPGRHNDAVAASSPENFFVRSYGKFVDSRGSNTYKKQAPEMHKFLTDTFGFED